MKLSLPKTLKKALLATMAVSALSGMNNAMAETYQGYYHNKTVTGDLSSSNTYGVWNGSAWTTGAKAWSGATNTDLLIFSPTQGWNNNADNTVGSTTTRNMNNTAASFGGIVVEQGATNWGIAQGTGGARTVTWNASYKGSTFFDVRENFSFAQGAQGTAYTRLNADVEMNIASAKTFTIQTGFQGGSGKTFTIQGGGTMLYKYAPTGATTVLAADWVIKESVLDVSTITDQAKLTAALGTGSITLANEGVLKLGSGVLTLNNDFVIGANGGSIAKADTGMLTLGGALSWTGTSGLGTLDFGSTSVNLSSTQVFQFAFGTEVGSYTLLTGGVDDWSSVDKEGFKVSGLGRSEYHWNQTTEGSLILAVTKLSEAADLVWNGSGSSMTWTADTSITNWMNAGQADAFYDADRVVFTDVGAGTVTINGNILAGSVTIESGDYTFLGADAQSKLSGTGALNVTGGSLTLNLANDYSGGTMVSGGILTASVANALGTGSVDVSDTGKLKITGAGVLDSVSGLTFSGSSQLELASGANQSISKAMTFTDNASLLLSGAGNLTYTGSMSLGAGGLTIASSAGVVYFNATKALNVTDSQTWTIAADKVLGHAGQLGNTATDKTVTIAGGGKVHLGGTIENAAKINWKVTDGSTLVVVDHHWGTSITLDDGIMATGFAAVNGGIGGNQGNWSLVDGTALNIGAGGGTIQLYHNNANARNLFIQGVISGTGDLLLSRTGSSVTADNDYIALTGSADMTGYDGTVTVDAANGTKDFTLSIRRNNMYAGDTVLTNSGGANAVLSFDTDASSLTYGGVISGNGKVVMNRANQTLTLTGANTYTGTTTITNGTVKLAGEGSLGNTAVTIAATGALEINKSKDLTLSQTLAGAGALKQTGSGTTTVSGANTGYSGAVSVTGGTLKVGGANSLGSGAVAVNGGSLNLNGQAVGNAITYTSGAVTGASQYAGAMTLAGDLTVAADEIFAAGSINTQNFQLTLESGSVLGNGSAMDMVGSFSFNDATKFTYSNEGGNLTASLNLMDGAFTLTGNTSIHLDLSSLAAQLNLDGISSNTITLYLGGEHTAINLGEYDLTVTINPNDPFASYFDNGTIKLDGIGLGNLEVLYVPEPGTASLSLLGLAGLLLKRRRKE